VTTVRATTPRVAGQFSEKLLARMIMDQGHYSSVILAHRESLGGIPGYCSKLQRGLQWAARADDRREAPTNPHG
jgi:hypothetical protein